MQRTGKLQQSGQARCHGFFFAVPFAEELGFGNHSGRVWVLFSVLELNRGFLGCAGYLGAKGLGVVSCEGNAVLAANPNLLIAAWTEHRGVHQACNSPDTAVV